MRSLPLSFFRRTVIRTALRTRRGVIGAVHAAGEARCGIFWEQPSEMCSLGARPEKIRAAIGPGIGGCCFETGPEVGEALFAGWARGAGVFVPHHPIYPRKRMVDLGGRTGNGS
jgi:copper oxidase (laccase) domain-containing protein